MEIEGTGHGIPEENLVGLCQREYGEFWLCHEDVETVNQGENWLT